MRTIVDGKLPRTIAIGLIRREDEVLVAEGVDPTKDPGVFYRPLGGAVEFGERSRDTLVREFKEELGAEVKVLRFLTTIENIFTYRGGTGHEIVLVYEAEFVDPVFYRRNELRFSDDDGAWSVAKWMRVGLFRDGQAPLYPEGLLEFIDTHLKTIRRRRR